jgi:hypothetical protein
MPSLPWRLWCCCAHRGRSRRGRARYLDPEQLEKDVYEKLYGERSGTIDASRVHLHEHVVIADHRLVDLPEFQDVN